MLTLDQYINQTHPLLTAEVLLQEGEFTMGIPVSSMGKTVTPVKVRGNTHLYVKQNDELVLYATDKYGTPTKPSCFFLPEPKAILEYFLTIEFDGEVEARILQDFIEDKGYASLHVETETSYRRERERKTTFWTVTTSNNDTGEALRGIYDEILAKAKELGGEVSINEIVEGTPLQDETTEPLPCYFEIDGVKYSGTRDEAISKFMEGKTEEQIRNSSFEVWCGDNLEEIEQVEIVLAKNKDAPIKKNETVFKDTMRYADDGEEFSD